MSLKQVELVRKRVVFGLSNEMVRLRSWISMLDGNQAAVELLREEAGQELLAVLTECVLAHLGHDTALSASAERAGRRSQAAKATRGAV